MPMSPDQYVAWLRDFAVRCHDDGRTFIADLINNAASCMEDMHRRLEEKSSEH